MTSSNTFPQKWTKIDDLLRNDHWYLTADDHCFFLGEYTARKGYSYSTTNNVILNFKKSVDRKGRSEWRYKEAAIRDVASAFRSALGNDIDNFTFVPTPPSKARHHELYDDRLSQMLRQMRPRPMVDIRDMVVQESSGEPSHLTESRPKPDDIADLYTIDTTLVAPTRKWIAVVDDVLTTGAHFKAMQAVLNQHFPDIIIIGLFVARRVPNADDILLVTGLERGIDRE